MNTVKCNVQSAVRLQSALAGKPIPHTRTLEILTVDLPLVAGLEKYVVVAADGSITVDATITLPALPFAPATAGEVLRWLHETIETKRRVAHDRALASAQVVTAYLSSDEWELLTPEERETWLAPRREAYRLEVDAWCSGDVHKPVNRIPDYADPGDLARCKAETDRRENVYGETVAAEREARKAKAAADAAAYAADRASWIAAHGSERLRAGARLRLLDNLDVVYVEERVAAERPGWMLDTCGKNLEIRNPSAEALQALEDALRTDPATQLVWLVVDDDDGEDEERGPALTAEFLGRDIIRRLF